MVDTHKWHNQGEEDASAGRDRSPPWPVPGLSEEDLDAIRAAYDEGYSHALGQRHGSNLDFLSPSNSWRFDGTSEENRRRDTAYKRGYETSFDGALQRAFENTGNSRASAITGSPDEDSNDQSGNSTQIDEDSTSDDSDASTAEPHRSSSRLAQSDPPLAVEKKETYASGIHAPVQHNAGSHASGTDVKSASSDYKVLGGIVGFVLGGVVGVAVGAVAMLPAAIPAFVIWILLEIFFGYRGGADPVFVTVFSIVLLVSVIFCGSVGAATGSELLDRWLNKHR